MFKRFTCLYLVLICLISLNTTVAKGRKIRHNLSAEEYYDIGLKHFQHKKYQKAADSFSKVFLANPTSSKVADAKLMEGKSLWLMKNYLEAALVLDQFIEQHPKHQEIENAYYLMALAEYKRTKYQYDLSQLETAKSVLEQFISLFPENKNITLIKEQMHKDVIQKIADYKLKVADYYFSQLNYHAARTRYYNIARLYPNTSCCKKAVLGLYKCDRLLLGNQARGKSLSSYYDMMQKLHSEGNDNESAKSDSAQPEDNGGDFIKK